MHPRHDATPHAPLVPGTTVVALHSSGAGARQWAPWRRLWPAGTEVVTPDLIGYADDASPLEAITLDDEARRVVHVVDAFPNGVHLVGHSYGGAVALRVALARPHRVRSLWLYEPVLFALLRDEDAPAWRDIVAAGRAIGALARAGRPEASASHFVDYWSGPGAWSALPAPRQRAIAERMPKVAAEFDALFDDDVPPAAYRTLHVPVRLLGGTRSPEPARLATARLAALLPQARLRTLEGLGHMGPVEDPARVAAAFGLPTTAATLSAAA